MRLEHLSMLYALQKQFEDLHLTLMENKVDFETDVKEALEDLVEAIIDAIDPGDESNE